MAQAYFKITLDDTDVPLTLTNNPAGIEDFEIKFKRHQTYGTIMRSVSETLRFVEEGRQYIKDVFDQFGIDGDCSINIKTLNLTNKTYSTIYDGYLDFSTYSEDDVYVEIAIVDKKDTTVLQSRESIDIDLLSTVDLDGNALAGLPSQDTLELSPVDVVLWAECQNVTADSSIIGQPSTGGVIFYPIGTTDPNFIGSEFDEVNLIYTNASGSNKGVIFKYNANSITVTGQIVITATSPGADTITFQVTILRGSDGAVLDSFIQSETGIGTYPINYSSSFSGEKQSTIPDGNSEGIAISIDYVFTAVGTIDYDFDMSMSEYEMTVIDASPVAASNCFAFKPLDALTRALKILGVSTAPTSDVFGPGGDYELCYITTGKRIRGFESDTPFNISFRDLFQSLSSIFGVWMDSDFYIDKHSSFLDSLTGLTILQWKNIEFKPAVDWYLSKANIGYPDQNYDESNGLIEYNTEFQYATKNKSDGSIDNVSIVRADGLGIEYTRRKSRDTAGTEDTDSDNDVFIISVVNDGGTLRPEIGSDFTTVTGLKNSDQYYNFFLTPKRNLIRNGLFLNTSLYYFLKEVQYVKSKNNIDLVVDGISELDGDYSNASSEKFKPVIMTFETVLNDALLVFLNTKTDQRLTIDGNSGYLMEADINLYKKSATISIVLV